MKTLIRFPALAGIGLMTAALLACAHWAPDSSPAPTPQPNAFSGSIPPTEPAATPGWAAILGVVSAPEGWQVTPCDNPVLLCVAASGELLGTVERFSYPLGQIDLAAPVEPTEGAEIAFLRAWVAEHYAAIQVDRQIADSSLIFTAEPPTEISVGGLPGLRYSFAATHPNVTLFDRYVGYVTTDGELLHVFVTGVISGDPGGTFSDSAALTAFEPYLDDIIRNLSLSHQAALPISQLNLARLTD